MAAHRKLKQLPRKQETASLPGKGSSAVSAGKLGRGKHTALHDVENFSMFVRMFGYLIKDGYSPINAVEILNAQNSGDIKAATNITVGKVRDGMDIASAFESSGYFPKEFSRILSVGEHSGYLNESLDMYGEYLEKVITMKNSFKSALTYPTFLLSFIFLMIGVILVFITPTIKDMAKDLAVPIDSLPMVSQMIFGFHDWISILGPLGTWSIILLVVYYLFLGKGREHIAKLISLIPKVRAMNNKIAWSQWLMLGSIAIKSGMKIGDMLGLLDHIELPKELSKKDAYKRIKKGIDSGRMLSDELMTTATPPIISQMISIGERSGRVDDSMRSIASQYLYQLNFDIKGVSAVIEPLIIAVVAVLGGGVAGALMYTVMSISSSVG